MELIIAGPVMTMLLQRLNGIQSGDIHELDGLSCDCQEVWKTEIELDQKLPIPLGSGKNRRGDAILHLRSP